LLIGIENVSHCGNNRATFKKLNISLLYNWTTALWDIYPREMNTYAPKNTQMFI
jgi:hypothetical protein